MDSVGFISRGLLATESFPTSSWERLICRMKHKESFSHPDLQTTPWYYGCSFILLALSQLLPWDVGRQMGESAVFLSLSFMRFYLANGKCCTVFLRFAFDTCSVSTKQWCYFSNIKGHYHSADCIWWCYISHSLSLYVISEILHIFSPN